MTQAFNLSQFANKVNTSGQADLTTAVTGTLPVGNGGIGTNTLTANNVLLGNGTSALQVVAPSTSGNVLTSNGTTWTSAAPTSSAPTTAQVQSAMAGSSAGDLGTYGFFTTVGTSYTQNTNIAGSNLYWFGMCAGGFNNPVATATSGAAQPSGTWKAMGRTNGGANNHYMNTFLRVA